MARNRRRLKDDWTAEAESQWDDILQYYTERNGSRTYSRRLKKQMDEAIRITCLNPEWGRPTVIPTIRWRLVEYFIVYYTVKTDRILVLAVWDARRNPESFPYLLEELDHGNGETD